MTLPPLDLAQIRKEDEATANRGEKRFRVGINRPLPNDLLQRGEWSISKGNTYWRLELETTGAIATRLFFAKAKAGAIVYVVPASGEAHVYPVNSEASQRLWTVPTEGALTRVEVEIPGEHAQEEIWASFKLAEIVHIYRDGVFGPSGSCNLDVSCYAEWRSTVSNSIGRMIMSGPGFTAVCSGTLINNNSNDYSPLFLTAKHCIDDGIDLDSVNVSWKYRSDTCNSSQRESIDFFSGGASRAQLLAEAIGSDLALLKLKGAISRQLTWAGWTSTDPSLSAAVTGVHHPHGDPQKISFGVVDTPDPSEPNYHRMHWTQGVTEGGSSGSPLFNEQKQILGTLSGGFSNCGNPSGDDFYGKLSTSYSALQQFLESGIPDDPFEPNNSFGAAVPLGVGTHQGLILKTDEDWYAIAVPANNRLTISHNVSTSVISFARGEVHLRRSDGATIGSYSSPSMNGGTVSYVAGPQSELVRLRVVAIDGTRTEYQLTVAVDAPAPVEVAPPTVQSSSFRDAMVFAGVNTRGFPATCRLQHSTESSFSVAVDSQPVTMGVGTMLSLVITGLEPNTQYWLRGVCNNVVGTSIGPALQFTTPVFNVVPGLGLPSDGSTPPSITPVFFWNGFGERYDILLGTTPDPPFYATVTPPNPEAMGSFVSGALQRGTTYYWRVRAHYRGYQTISPVRSFTTFAREITVLPAVIQFSNTLVGRTSVASVGLQNGYLGGVIVTNVSVSGAFRLVQNCTWVSGNVVGGGCTVQVEFAPTSMGSHEGTLFIHDSSGLPPQAIAISGQGTDILLRLSRATRPLRAGGALGPAESREAQVELDSGGGVLAADTKVECVAFPGLVCETSPLRHLKGSIYGFAVKMTNVGITTKRAHRLRRASSENTAVQVKAVVAGITRTLSIPITIRR